MKYCFLFYLTLFATSFSFADAKNEDVKLAEQKPVEQKTTVKETAEQKPVVKESVKQETTEQKTTEQKPVVKETVEQKPAERNNSKAAIEKLLNSRASGSLKAFSEAATEVAEAAKKGEIIPKYLIAVLANPSSSCEALRISDKKRKKYLESSRPSIEKLAEKSSNSMALYLLYLETRDETLLKRAADGNNIQALNTYGTVTLTKAISDLSIDPEEKEKILKRSVEYFNRAASKKDANALYNLGMCAMNGYGCPEDNNLAFNYFRSAAEMGHPDAINNLGGFCRDGIIVEKDLVLATKWFAKSAELGNLYGEFNYGLALQRGEGIKRDINKAIELFKDAAKKGSPEAMNAYGMCLLSGDGCDKNEIEAIRWYRAAASMGFAPAMENLSECYASGFGGLKKDYKASVLWKVRSRAVSGDINAMAWLKQNGHSITE